MANDLHKVVIQVEANTEELNKLRAEFDKTKKTNEDFRKSVKETGKQAGQSFDSMLGSLKNVGAAMGIAFGVNELVNFGKEAVKLASQMEGVSKSFKDLNNPNLLNELRKATNGTVSDLKLMQNAVKANNFKIPMEQLGKLFEFASKRARQTGESVEYLTDSIVLGLSRKSPQILDNLGISMSELNKEVEKTGDFMKGAGSLIEKELALMGEASLSAGEKLAQTGAHFENLQTTIGQMLLNVGEPLIDFVDDWIQGFSAMLGATNDAKKGVDEFSGATQQMIISSVKAAEVGLSFLELEKARLESLGASGQAIDELTKRIDQQRLVLSRAIEEEKKDKTARESLIKIQEEQLAIAQLLPETTEQELIVKNRRIKQISDEITRLRELGVAEKKAAKNKKDSTEKELTQILDKDFKIIASIDKREQEEADMYAYLDKLRDEGLQAELDSLKYEDEVHAAMLDKWKKREEEKKRLEEERLNQQRAYQDAAIDLANIASSALFEIKRNQLEEETNYELSLLDEKLAKRQISEKKYDQQRKKILLQQAEQQKKIATFQAIIQGALAVVNALATGGPYPYNLISAAVVAASTGAEVAVIQSEPLPKFAKGGEVGGKLHRDGGTLIEAEKGEYVISRKSTEKHKDLLEAINEDRLGDYLAHIVYEPKVKRFDEQKQLSTLAENIAESISLHNTMDDERILNALMRLNKTSVANTQHLVSALHSNQDLRNK